MAGNNKRIDVSKLSFPDQFDGKFFDNTLPSSVILNTNSINYLDIQAGLNYAYFPTEDIYLNGGYSIHHVNGPQETFFSGIPDSSKIPMRHIGFLNALIKVNDRVILFVIKKATIPAIKKMKAFRLMIATKKLDISCRNFDWEVK